MGSGTGGSPAIASSLMMVPLDTSRLAAATLIRVAASLDKKTWSSVLPVRFCATFSIGIIGSSMLHCCRAVNKKVKR